MGINQNMSDDAILNELGGRIAQIRLNKNITQESLAMEAGVSVPTIKRIEQGRSASFTNFIRILRALKHLDNLELVIPEPPVSPMMKMRMKGKKRARASLKKKEETSKQPWTWGDQ